VSPKSAADRESSFAFRWPPPCGIECRQADLNASGCQQSPQASLQHLPQNGDVSKKDFHEIYDIAAIRLIAGPTPRMNAIGPWRSSTMPFGPSPVGLKTISACPSPTATSPYIRWCSATWVSPLRCKFAPWKCTTWPSTGLPPTGNTKKPAPPATPK
jgi:hypothetical protein